MTGKRKSTGKQPVSKATDLVPHGDEITGRLNWIKNLVDQHTFDGEQQAADVNVIRDIIAKLEAADALALATAIEQVIRRPQKINAEELAERTARSNFDVKRFKIVMARALERSKNIPTPDQRSPSNVAGLIFDELNSSLSDASQKPFKSADSLRRYLDRYKNWWRFENTIARILGR